MSTELTWQIISISSADTESLGEKIGSRLRGDETIELSSDVGGGKTTFVKGLSRGAGSDDHVASPSFTISREYAAPNFMLEHFDFYRLDDPGIMTNELAEFLVDDHTVVVVEWPGITYDILPGRRLRIVIEHKNETTRALSFYYPQQLSYLIPE